MIRRTALILLVALLASPASALKAPKSLCLSIAGSRQLVLVTKKVGTATTAAGKTTFYQLAGEATFPVVTTSVLVVGSGRLAGDVLDFQVTGSNLREIDTSFSALHFQGTWDLVQKSGVISSFILFGDGAAQALTETQAALAETECAGIVLVD
jgi:hypothetical protein